MNLAEISDEDLQAEMQRRMEIKRAAEREWCQSVNKQRYDELNRQIDELKSKITGLKNESDYLQQQAELKNKEKGKLVVEEEKLFEELLNLDIKEPKCNHGFRSNFKIFVYCINCRWVVNRDEIENAKEPCSECGTKIHPTEECSCMDF
jgi:hypothetical protein